MVVVVMKEKGGSVKVWWGKYNGDGVCRRLRFRVGRKTGLLISIFFYVYLAQNPCCVTQIGFSCH